MTFWRSERDRRQITREALIGRLADLAWFLKKQSNFSWCQWRKELTNFFEQILEIRSLFCKQKTKAECQMEKHGAFYSRAMSCITIDLRNGSSKHVARLEKKRQKIEKDFNHKTFKFKTELKSIESSEKTTNQIASSLCDFLSEKWKRQTEIVELIDECLKHKLGFHQPPVPKTSLFDAPRIDQPTFVSSSPDQTISVSFPDATQNCLAPHASSSANAPILSRHVISESAILNGKSGKRGFKGIDILFNIIFFFWNFILLSGIFILLQQLLGSHQAQRSNFCTVICAYIYLAGFLAPFLLFQKYLSGYPLYVANHIVKAGMLYMGGNVFLSILLLVEFSMKVLKFLVLEQIFDSVFGTILALLLILLFIADFFFLYVTIFAVLNKTPSQSDYSSKCSHCFFNHKCKPENDKRSFCRACENVKQFQRHCNFCKSCFKRPSFHSTIAGCCIGRPNVKAFIITMVLMVAILCVLLWALFEVGQLDDIYTLAILISVQVYLYQIVRSYYVILWKPKTKKKKNKVQ